MILVEDGAWAIFEPIITEYERHFNRIFPLYEHLAGLGNADYTISLTGAERLKAILLEAIRTNKPFPVPDDYSERLY